MYKRILITLFLATALIGCSKSKDVKQEVPIIEEKKELQADKFKINGDELSFPLTVGDLKEIGYIARYPKHNYIFNEVYTKQLTELRFDRGEKEFIRGFVYADEKEGADKAKIKDFVIKKDDNTTLSVDQIKYDTTKEETLNMLNEYDNIKDIIDEENILKFTVNNTIVELSFIDDKLYSIKLTDKSLEDIVI